MSNVDHKQLQFSGDINQLERLLDALEQRDLMIWNSWRQSYPNLELNLKGINLSGIDLTGIDLNGKITEIYESTIDGVMSYTIITRGTDLQGADFSGANLSLANLICTDLSYALLEQANLEEADLRWSCLERASLVRAKAARVNLSKAIITNANLEWAFLSGANLSNATLDGANIRWAYLGDATLTKAHLVSADCSASLMPQADFSQATLRDSSFRGSRAPSCILKKAHCDSAEFANADLEGADLSESDFTRCRFNGANLKLAKLTGAILHETATDGWVVERIVCDYFYVGSKRDKRVPNKRNFEPGEFEAYARRQKAIAEAALQHALDGRLRKHIFISYVKEDYEKVRRLQEYLEAHGCSVWIDRERLQPGVDWQIAIEMAIQNGVYFVACFSSNYQRRSRNKTYMNEELHIAVEQMRQMPDDEIWLIPARLDECKLPNIRIAGNRTLSNKQWVDLFPDFDKGASKIVELINSNPT